MPPPRVELAARSEACRVIQGAPPGPDRKVLSLLTRGWTAKDRRQAGSGRSHGQRQGPSHHRQPWQEDLLHLSDQSTRHGTPCHSSEILDASDRTTLQSPRQPTRLTCLNGNRCTRCLFRTSPINPGVARGSYDRVADRPPYMCEPAYGKIGRAHV